MGQRTCSCHSQCGHIYTFSTGGGGNFSLSAISLPKVMATPSYGGPFSLTECPASSSTQKLLILFLFSYNKA